MSKIKLLGAVAAKQSETTHDGRGTDPISVPLLQTETGYTGEQHPVGHGIQGLKPWLM
jgi:hypothetical protein